MPALLLAITIGFHWKLVLPGQYTWLDSPDNAVQVVEWLQAQAAQWHAGHFPLWDPYLWGGQPFAGQVQPGSLNPLNWILFSMPLQDGFIRIPVLHWYWVSIQFLGVLFAFLLCRDLKLSRTASILGGCAFGLGGYLGAIGWPQQMMSAVLTPLILLFLLRVMRGERPLANAAASGALQGASFLSGHHNVPLFFTLVVGGLWITHILWARRQGWRKLVAPLLAFSACFALVAAVQVLPAIELGKLSLRWAGPPLAWDQRVPYAVHEQFSLHPLAILGIVIPGFQWDSAIFAGMVASTLGILGAIARREERMVKVLAAVSLAGLLFALGSNGLVHGILYALLPGLDKARSPSMAEAIFQLGLIVLAAYGVDSFRSSLAEPARRIAVRVLSLAGIVLFAALVLLITVRPEQSEEYKNLAMAGFVALALAGILRFWDRSRISNFAAGVLLILLLLFELNIVTNYTFPPFHQAGRLQRLYQDPDVAAYLKKVPQPVRIEANDNDVPYNFGDWYGVSEFGGVVPTLLKAVYDGASERRFRRLLSVNYYVGRESKEPDRRLVFEGQSGLKVFQNSSAMPRARIAHATITIPHPNDVIGASLDVRTNLERTVLLPESAPALENCEGGTASYREDTPARVVVRTESPCRSMLVLADVWYPGWTAYLDGKPAQIWKAYNVIRGVVVEQGQHDVVMIYRPLSVYAGAALAVLGIIICVFLQFTRRSRARWSHLPPPTPTTLNA